MERQTYIAEDIYAVVMAGGEGARLRPITDSIPKPLAPIAGEPVLSHMLRLLKRCGVGAAALTLLYKGEQIANLYGAEFEGLPVRPIFEKKPMGTAGSVKGAAGFLKSSGSDLFFVVSGDAVCDLDLQKAANFHRERGAEATLVLTRVPNPLEYGIVVGDMDGEGGRIEGFIEKPPYSLAYSDLVNTGIYVLSKSVLDSIPDGMPFDFARDLFSKMLKEGRGLYGYVFDGYWCDIGSPEAYRRCCLDAAAGKIRGIADRFSHDRSVVGGGCRVGEGTQLVDSVLQKDVTVGENCKIEAAILCSGARIGDGVTISAGSVIGPGCVIGDRVFVGAGARIEGKMRIKPDTRLAGAVGSDYERLVYEEEISVADTAFALRAGGAVVRAVRGGAVGFAHDGNDAARKRYQSFLEGAEREGGAVYALGSAHRQLAAFGARQFGLLATGYLWQKGDDVFVTFYDKNGQILPHSFKRSFAKELTAPAQASELEGKPVADVSEALLYAYLDALTAQGGGRDGLHGVRLQVQGGGAARLFARAAEGCGAVLCDQPEEGGFACLFDDTGSMERINQWTHGKCFSVDRAHARAVLLAFLVDGGSAVSLSCAEPAVYDRILKDKGCQVLRYATVPADHGEDAVRERAARYPWLQDDCFAAITLLRLAARGAEFEALCGALPPFGTLEFELDGELKDPTELVRHFCQMARKQRQIPDADCPTGGDGVLISHRQGFARILVPSNRKIRVICDGVSAEAAEELAGFARRDIENFLKKIRRAARGITKRHNLWIVPFFQEKNSRQTKQEKKTQKSMVKKAAGRVWRVFLI